MLLYNRQLGVITHEPIYGGRAAHHQGKIGVKQYRVLWYENNLFVINKPMAIYLKS